MTRTTRPTRALALAASALCTLCILWALAGPLVATLGAQGSQDARRTGRAQGAMPRTARMASAESSAAAARARVAGSALDTWIVMGFRGAALLPVDTLRDSTSRSASLPRVESVRMGRSLDTLFALHFDARSGPAAARVGDLLRLVGPTGTRTDITMRVLASREFRAPTTPPARGASARPRAGWAYLVVLPRPAGAANSAFAYRGWLLVPEGAR